LSASVTQQLPPLPPEIEEKLRQTNISAEQSRERGDDNPTLPQIPIRSDTSLLKNAESVQKPALPTSEKTKNIQPSSRTLSKTLCLSQPTNSQESNKESWLSPMAPHKSKPKAKEDNESDKDDTTLVGVSPREKQNCAMQSSSLPDSANFSEGEWKNARISEHSSSEATEESISMGTRKRKMTRKGSSPRKLQLLAEKRPKDADRNFPVVLRIKVADGIAEPVRRESTMSANEEPQKHHTQPLQQKQQKQPLQQKQQLEVHQPLREEKVGDNKVREEVEDELLQSNN